MSSLLIQLLVGWALIGIIILVIYAIWLRYHPKKIQEGMTKVTIGVLIFFVALPLVYLGLGQLIAILFGK
jgi:hypothetical protein